MPWRAYSTAISRVIESTPPLLAVYAICAVAAPINATNDATLTIEPPPDASIAGMPGLAPEPHAFEVDGHDPVATSPAACRARRRRRRGRCRRCCRARAARRRCRPRPRPSPRQSSHSATSARTNVASPPASRTAATVVVPGVLVDVADDDARAFARRRARPRHAAHPAARAGDQRDLAFESPAHELLSGP